ncbi:DNA cytosine methyltransferase [Marivirga sp.]|uniref:DNA cytosine methyltransferase n=1 Tax=Marivirga sp. TaxID=2018662 RepID=UPI003DA6D359
MKAIDLYSGIGGWTLGLKMAGIEVISSYEWWKDANHTHNKNFGTNHKERDIRKLDLVKDLPDHSEVDFVVGSPPCTQFSYANRGGGGDLADGLVDIYKFLEVVDYLKPKYWAMENVPRVAGILRLEIQEGGGLNKFKHLFEGGYGTIEVYDSSEFGVPQNRKRMIAGRFPRDLFESYREMTQLRHLRDVVESLASDEVCDPIYGHTVANLTDHIEETPLTQEEERINKDSKTFHPVYNKMSFPDKLDRPSRTVTALCTRVSRESIIIEGNKGFRRLTVRERGCIQSFPADFQFYSNSYGGKLKMIGNAVPPLLTYYLAQSMLETPQEKLPSPKSENKIVNNSDNLPKFFEPEFKGNKFSWSRSFWLAIPGLRFGSGVRFELRNVSNKEIQKVDWWINFHYGNSKKNKQLPLEENLFNDVWESLLIMDINLEDYLKEYIEFIKNIDVNGLQENWTNKDRSKNGPIWLVDQIGIFSENLINEFKKYDFIKKNKLKELTEHILRNGNGALDNKKLADFPEIIISGILIGSIFNIVMINKEVRLPIITNS